MFWSKRDSTTSPSAYSIPGTRTWLNDDGAWSTFALDVGAGPAGSQSFSAVVSTSGLGTWLPNSLGCNDNSVVAPLKPADCPPSRGIGLYNGQQSTGYNPNNSIAAQSVGSATPSSFNSNYGPEIALLYSDQLQVRPLKAISVPVFSVSGASPLLSTFGIGSGTIQTGSNVSKPFLNVLNDSKTIPSPSWGYTAGAKYADRTASLVLGGYDADRINGSSLRFDMSPKGTLDVIVDSLSLNFNNGSDAKAAPASTTGFTASIDSSTPHLYLPNTTINWLASTLHLSEYGRLFYYSSIQSEANATLSNVAGYSITLRSPADANKTVTLNFPLLALSPISSWTYEFRNEVNISLFRRADSSHNVVLGRAFFQEAYVVADFAKQSFQVSQTTYAPTTESIVASGAGAAGTGSTKLSSGAIAGIVIGCLAAFLISAGLLWLLWLRPRREKAHEARYEPVAYAKAELDGAPADTKEVMSEPVFEVDNGFKGNELEVVQAQLPPVELEGDSQLTTLRLPRRDDQD